MKIVVLGSSILSQPSIEILIQQNLLAGLCMIESEDESFIHIRGLAQQANIENITVTRDDYKSRLNKWLKRLKPDVVLVITFPFFIPENLLTLANHGFYNFHFAALPQYRGAMPIFWELINGEKQGAICVHKMTNKIDKGPLLINYPVIIEDDANYGMHVIRLAYESLNVIHKFIELFNKPNLENHFEEQDENLAKTYPTPTQSDVTIDWNRQTAPEIATLVRACNPWNKGAITYFNGMPYRIIEASSLPEDTIVTQNNQPGEIQNVDCDNGLIVTCAENSSLNCEIILTKEGYFTGKSLKKLGIKKGDLFHPPVI